MRSHFFCVGNPGITCAACPHVPSLCDVQVHRRFGVQIQVIPETAEGDIDVCALQRLLAQQVSTRCISAAKNGKGKLD